MKKLDENKLINLGYFAEESGVNNDWNNVITAIETESIIQPKVLNHSLALQYSLVGAHWIFLTIGSYFRLILYRYFYDQFKQKSIKTIDRLILVLAILHHLSVFFASIEITLKVLNIPWLGESTFGYAGCIFKSNFYKIEMTYQYIGSLCLACYRFLYIKKGFFVKDVVGEENMANVMLFLGIGISASMIWVPRMFDQGWSHLELEPCLNMAQTHHALEFLDSYEQSRGLMSPLANWKRAFGVPLMIDMLATVTEMCLYILFFHFMYKNDNNERLARLLEPSVIRQRNKTNAITFFGQFCSFVFEITGEVLFIVAVANSAPEEEDGGNDLYIYAFLCRPATFLAMSVIEVITSNTLRSRMSIS